MTSKTIAVFTSQNILNTQDNQKQILQALHDGMNFKELENNFVVIDLVLKDFDEATAQEVEVRVTSLSHLSCMWCNADLEESQEEDFLSFISFEQVTNFNIWSV